MLLQPTVVVIGAGIAGIICARVLNKSGVSVLVLEKSKGTGGRMATRRIGDAAFDHGAQYFSTKTPDFQRLVKEAASAGIVREWRPNITDKVHPRWIGTQGMNSVPKYIAGEIPILKNEKVHQIREKNSGWEVLTESGGVYQADAMVSAIPAPQANAILKESKIDLPETPFDKIAYHPCFALLLTLKKNADFAPYGGLMLDNEVISWIADNNIKGVSKLPSLTIHATPAFSTQYLEEDPKTVAGFMMESVRSLVSLSDISDIQLHRWRYSLAYMRYEQAFWKAPGVSTLYFGGDGFGMGNIEGAFNSGLSIARDIIENLR
jgi:predicted NAD/FAD-dependent oxidoreductase